MSFSKYLMVKPPSPPMRRFLLEFGYIGTQFSGVQRQIAHGITPSNDIITIQEMLELALEQLRPLNQVKLGISSRTDSGVHAFRSTAHVDLQFSYEHQYNAFSITKAVNKFLKDTDLDIRLHNVRHVPDEFNARFNAQWRKYIYRVAVIKPTDKRNNMEDNFFIPMTEHNRCYIILNKPFIHIDLAKKCAKMLEGEHDFRTFMAVDKLSEKRGLDIRTVRTLEQVDILPARAFFENAWDLEFDFWNFHVKGKGFLYKQVRKMVTALSKVAQGDLTEEEFRFLLENPSVHNWLSKLHVFPAYGLYLMDVGYREEDLVVEEDKRNFSLILESIEEAKKIDVIKLFQELHGACSSLQAKDKIDALPTTVRKDLVKSEAKYYQALFKKINCNVRVEETSREET